MNEIERLVEKYLSTSMTAETFMRKARPLWQRAAAERVRNRSGQAPATEESTTVPTESATGTISTVATGVANDLTSPAAQQKGADCD